MNTEPTGELLEQMQDQADTETAAETDRVIAGVEGGDPIIDELGEGPDIEIVVDGRRLNLAEIADLFDKPLEELTDAERAAIQPLLDEAEAAQQPEHVQADPLELGGQLLIEALAALRTPASTGQHHSPAWKLAEKIALGHAFAVHAQAAAARMHAQAAHRQLQLLLEQRELMVGKQGGLASSIVVPTVGLRRG